VLRPSTTVPEERLPRTHAPATAPRSPDRPVVVSFTAPRSVRLVEEVRAPLLPGTVRVRTLYSGISAGTELTAYRGSNPYLAKNWDPGRRLFTDGGSSVSYPIVGWGYSEVGRIAEVADDVDQRVPGRRVGDVVYGIWGHRSEAVLPVEATGDRVVPPSADPIVGVFARVGAVALNAVLAAEPHLGETVAVFGQGVIGLLATRMAALSGARVIAVDTLPARRALATRMGATLTLDAADPSCSVAEAVKRVVPDGADVTVELSGSYPALQEAVRATAPGGRVVAAGFYQGEADGLRLGEEFHHNRIQLVSSQIGGVPTGLVGRWTPERLHRAFMGLVFDGRVDVAPLISHVVPGDEVADVYRLLDERPGEALQTVLDFRVADMADRHEEESA
jgi:2-desacetyl-2-hydroxyethyl bacteriochlorophyllide A dehydrogenase